MKMVLIVKKLPRLTKYTKCTVAQKWIRGWRTRSRHEIIIIITEMRGKCHSSDTMQPPSSNTVGDAYSISSFRVANHEHNQSMGSIRWGFGAGPSAALSVCAILPILNILFAAHKNALLCVSWCDRINCTVMRQMLRSSGPSRRKHGHTLKRG